MALRQREDLDAGGGDADRMLELRRQRAVAGDGGPAVRQDPVVITVCVDKTSDAEPVCRYGSHSSFDEKEQILILRCNIN